MSNRAKPTKLKLLEGRRGHRPINRNEPEPEVGIPPMPKWLEEFPIAVGEWGRESSLLDSVGVLTIADGGVLAMRCYLASQIQELAADIRTEGRTFQWKHVDLLGNEIMVSKSNPKTIQLKHLITEYRACGSLLGCDPASRTKLNVEPGRGKLSKFDGLVKGIKK